MVVLKFTVEFGAHSGRIDWLMPEACWRRSARRWPATAASTPLRKQEAWAPVLGAALQDDGSSKTRAVLAQAQISLGELVRLSPGDIIPIERRSTSRCWPATFRCIAADSASRKGATHSRSFRRSA
jgi:flagellar motor switch protein FliM